MARRAPSPLDAMAALRAEGVSVIAEVKRASPSRGGREGGGRGSRQAVQDRAAPVHSRCLLPQRQAEAGFVLPGSSRRMVASSLHKRRAVHEAGSPDGVSMGDLPRCARPSPRLPSQGTPCPRRLRSRCGSPSSAGTPTGPIPTPSRWHCMRAGSRRRSTRPGAPGSALRLAPAARPALPFDAVPVRPLLLRAEVDQRRRGQPLCPERVLRPRPAEDRLRPRVRFPFVAYAMNGRIKVWGRTADGHPHQVVVERKVNGKWRSVKKPTANAYGILSARWRSSDRTHVYRAQCPAGPIRTASA